MASSDAQPPRGTVTSVRLAEEPLFSSVWLRPSRVLYRQEGAAGGNDVVWDIVESWDACGILLYHRDRKAFLAVRQFRPAVWASRSRALQSGFVPSAEGRPSPSTAVADATVGFTLELCGGLCNKAGLSLAQIAAEEVEEEMGYRVDPDALVPLFCMTEAVGLLGTSLHVFYAEVSDACRVSDGGGLEGENEVVSTVDIDAAGALDFLAATQAAGTPVSGDLLHALLLMTLPQPVRGRLLEGAAAAFASVGRAPGASPSSIGAAAASGGSGISNGSAAVVPSRAARAAAAASFGSSTAAGGAEAFAALLERGGYRIVRVGEAAAEAGAGGSTNSNTGSSATAAGGAGGRIGAMSPPTSPVVLLSGVPSAAESPRSIRTGSGTSSSSSVEVSSAGTESEASAAATPAGETAGGLVNWLKRLVGRAPAAPAPGASVTAPAPAALGSSAHAGSSAFAAGHHASGSGQASSVGSSVGSSMGGSGFVAPSLSQIGGESSSSGSHSNPSEASAAAMDASALLQEMTASRGSLGPAASRPGMAASGHGKSGSSAAWAPAHGTDAAALEQVLARSGNGSYSVHLDGEANQLARLAPSPSPAASQLMRCGRGSSSNGGSASSSAAYGCPGSCSALPASRAASESAVRAAGRATFLAELRRAARELPILALYDAFPCPDPCPEPSTGPAGQLQSAQAASGDPGEQQPQGVSAARPGSQEPSPASDTSGAVVLRLSPPKVAVVALAAAGLLALGFFAGRWHAKRTAAATVKAAVKGTVAGAAGGAAGAVVAEAADALLDSVLGDGISPIITLPITSTGSAPGPASTSAGASGSLFSRWLSPHKSSSSSSSSSGSGSAQSASSVPVYGAVVPASLVPVYGAVVPASLVPVYGAVVPAATGAALLAIDAAQAAPSVENRALAAARALTSAPASASASASVPSFTPAALDKATLSSMSPAEIRAAAVAIEAAHTAATSPTASVTPVVLPPNSIPLDTPVEMSVENAAGRVSRALAALRGVLDDWWRQMSG